MAIKATVYKANVQVTDMDRNHYAGYDLTVALHPSETEERLMVRLLAFALLVDQKEGHEQLGFTKGLSTDDEPDLWQKSLADEILLWVDLGQPDEKRLRKACGRAKQVTIVNYNDKSDIWWEQNKSKVTRFSNLSILQFPENQVIALAKLSQRSMQLNMTIQDGEVWVSGELGEVSITPNYRLKSN
ncbi:YaeQ family protein [Marinomonas sp. 15G1-11]|uniref:YaeQ family protein n=1 Tax=Marinomonas phaeophyticola TaxID=3004091 RepID=A0ABT4JPN5_9GAMM|nr:YaeQ family protein [Marinomonas sp. 15G1-11]MCZ2720328.1 YaeQ family protein [Marinomonas sp. 15G1-11]